MKTGVNTGVNTGSKETGSGVDGSSSSTSSNSGSAAASGSTNVHQAVKGVIFDMDGFEAQSQMKFS